MSTSPEPRAHYTTPGAPFSLRPGAPRLRDFSDDTIPHPPLSVSPEPGRPANAHHASSEQWPLVDNPPEKAPVSSCPPDLHNQRNNPARRVPSAWLPACLTLILLTLTALYAFRPSLWKSDFVNSSQSNAIFVLRALSELTGFVLAITVASSFEIVQWLLTVHVDGMALTDYLALQPGTGIFALMGFAVGRSKGQGHAMLWSVLRLIIIVLLPGLGVLIMSNVSTRLEFDPVGQTTAPLGFGLGPVNSSVAGSLAAFTDVIFGASFSGFLDDPSMAIDITPDASQRRSCSLAIDVRGRETCERLVYLAAGQDQMSGQILTDEHPQADSWFVRDHQGYVLHFTQSDQDQLWTFDNATECRTYYTEVLTSSLGAFRMCVKNVALNHVQARISSCSTNDILHQNCHNESAWNSTPAWTTSLQTSYRQAKMAYSRLNGTILSHEFIHRPSQDKPASFNASDILQAWDNFLGIGDGINDITTNALSLLGLGPGKYLFPAMVSSMLNSISDLAPTNPALNARAVNALQSILTIPIHWCQTGYLERAAVSALSSNVFLLNSANIVLPDGIERNSSVFFAVTRNQIAVGRATVVSYVILTGALLALCFLVLCVGTYSDRSTHIPRRTAFPALDFCLHCVLTSRAGRVLTEGGHFQEPKSSGDGEVGISEIRLKLARSSTAPSAAES